MKKKIVKPTIRTETRARKDEMSIIKNTIRNVFIANRCEDFNEWEAKCLNYKTEEFVPSHLQPIVLASYGKYMNLNYEVFWELVKRLSVE